MAAGTAEDGRRSAPVVLAVDPDLAGAPDAPDVALSLSSFAASRVTLPGLWDAMIPPR